MASNLRFYLSKNDSRIDRIDCSRRNLGLDAYQTIRFVIDDIQVVSSESSLEPAVRARGGGRGAFRGGQACPTPVAHDFPVSFVHD